MVTAMEQPFLQDEPNGGEIESLSDYFVLARPAPRPYGEGGTRLSPTIKAVAR